MSLKLMDYQEKGKNLLLENKRFPLFMEAGTGKTPVIIETMKELYFSGKVNRVLIFAPNSILANWEDEINQWMQCNQHYFKVLNLHSLNTDISKVSIKELSLYHDEFKTLSELNKSYLTQVTKDNREQIEQQQPKKLLIILANYEKVQRLNKELEKFSPQMLVCDESHNLKSHTSKQSKRIKSIGSKCEYVYLLTGTPIIQGPQDLYMQYQIMQNKQFGVDYHDFKEHWLKMGGFQGKQVVGYRNERKLKRLLKKNMFRVRLKDVVNLPGLTRRDHLVSLEDEAKALYNELQEEMITTIDRDTKLSRKSLEELLESLGVYIEKNESIESLVYKAEPFLNTTTCELVVTQLIRLQQIAGGFITLDTGEVVQVSERKIKALISELSLLKEPAIVFCRFIPEIELIYNTIKDNFRVGVMRGKESSQVYRDFRAGKYDVLLLQIQSGSVGLNLQRASTAIFYSWDFSAGNYVQAIARIRRKGQDKPMEIVFIKAQGTVDDKIITRVEKKIRVSTKLLDS